MPEFLEPISKRIQAIVTFILLHGVYLVGIGIPSLISKLVHKKFLNDTPVASTWTNHVKKIDDHVMY